MTPSADESLLIPPPNNPPMYTLFDANAVGLATFFGTPAAGCLLMAINDRRLGNTGRAMLTMFAGIAVTALVILIGWNIPQGASFPIAIALVFATRWSAEKMQGTALQQHLEQGGRLSSRWTAFWLSLVFLVLLFAVVFAVVYSNDNQRNGVMIGKQDEVFYSGTATSAEAQALGNALKSIGYFTDKGANVFVEKGNNGTIVTFVVADGTWDKPDMVQAFETITRGEASTVGGLPITLRLENTSLDIKKSELLK